MGDSPSSKSRFKIPIRFSGLFPKNLPARYTRWLASANLELLAIGVIFLLNILLVSPKLMPGFTEVNPYDEVKYVESGWLLLKGEVRNLAWGPLVAVVYAPVHLLIGNLPDWFMLETWIGRFLMFSFMWLSLVYLAYQLKDHAPPLVAVGLLFVTVPLFPILRNQSDAVFVGLSVLGLANLITFSRSLRLKYVCLASICVGLGTLARVETVVLIGSLAAIALAVGRRRCPALKILAAAILPAAGILVVLFSVNLITVGNLNLGISNKSYASFEVNQSILTGGDLAQARQESRRLFGTEEQNNSSVVRAILRNPGAFAARILANAKWTARFYLTVFGKTQGFVLLLFSAWGVYVLIRKRAFMILAILFLWPLHALIPLGFLARHVIPQVYYLPMILGALGMAAALDLDSPPQEKAALLIASLLCCLYSWADHKPAFFSGSILVVAVFGISWILRPRLQSSGSGRLAPLLFLLSAGLILRDPYPFPDYPSPLGKSSVELAVHYMESSLPARSNVLSTYPQPAVASGMVNVSTRTVPKDVAGARELWVWLSARDIRAAYLNAHYKVDKDIISLMESDLGQYFDIGFTSDDKISRVYRLREKADIP